MIDLHAHVLPGIDDGPASLPEAVRLARAIAAGGVETVVATSHVSDRFPNRPDTLAAARERLCAALQTEGIALEVLPGAEVTLEQAAELDDATLAALRLGGDGCLLVESPLSAAAVDVEPAIRRLMDRGHPIVLAHPERAPCFQRDRRQLVRLVADGVLTSITAGAVRGHFGRTAAEMARWMLEEELVHDIASDAHDLDGRPPGVLLEELGPAGRWLVTAAPAAILRGERPAAPPVPVAPPQPPRRRGGLRRWLRRR